MTENKWKHPVTIATVLLKAFYLTPCRFVLEARQASLLGSWGAARGDQAPGHVGAVVRPPLSSQASLARGKQGLRVCCRALSWYRPRPPPGSASRALEKFSFFRCGVRGWGTTQVCASVRGSPPAGAVSGLTALSPPALREKVGGRVRQAPSPVAMATAGKPASGPPAAGRPGVQRRGGTWG